jgi:rhodanese-related sulfurtransferase
MAEGPSSVMDATPEEAFEAVSETAARLVDVRTRPEWTFTGMPALGEREVVAIEWQTYPSMQVAADFADRLVAAVPDKSVPLYFMCRSGARSLAAARLAASLGYQHVFNVMNGFEGPPDQDGHRGTVAGWRAAGLPWTQS